MADLHIVISSPQLHGSEYFKIRYRTLPNGVWSSYANVTVNNYDITGLSAGLYQIEIIFVTEDGIECDAVYQTKEVLPPFSCSDFAAQINEKPSPSGLFYVDVNFTIATIPACGWTIELTDAGGTSTFNYPVLTGSSFSIKWRNTQTNIKIYANLCGGNRTLCFDYNMLPIPVITPCVPAVILSYDIVPTIVPYEYSLNIVFTQSTPVTKGANIYWQQKGTPRTAGQVLDFGSYITAGQVYQNAGGGNVQIWLHTIRPIPTIFNPSNPAYEYEVKFIDECGTSHVFTILFE